MPAKQKPPTLPDSEIQALADTALEAWSSGVPGVAFDSKGDHWEFEPIRDANARLVIRRFTPPPLSPAAYEETLAAEGQMPAYEFGLTGTRANLTSRVLAIANPAA